jgi:hypothetical protein
LIDTAEEGSHDPVAAPLCAAQHNGSEQHREDQSGDPNEEENENDNHTGRTNYTVQRYK